MLVTFLNTVSYTFGAYLGVFLAMVICSGLLLLEDMLYKRIEKAVLGRSK